MELMDEIKLGGTVCLVISVLSIEEHDIERQLFNLNKAVH